MMMAGKKTFLGCILFGALAALYGIDAALHDDPATQATETAWLAIGWYTSVGAMITAFTGVSFRLAIKKAESSPK
jgi:hypothetical protein